MHGYVSDMLQHKALFSSRKAIGRPIPLSKAFCDSMTSLGVQIYSPRGLCEKLRVPRGKRKAGAARQLEARGFWARAREVRGRKARATEAILEVLKGGLEEKEEVKREEGRV